MLSIFPSKLPISDLLKQALGSHLAIQTPRIIENVSTEYLVDGVVMQDFIAENRFKEAFVFSVASPKARIFDLPVIAAHQTNEVGRKEVFSQEGDAMLNYGLALARRGHRVFGLDLRWAGEMKRSTYWDFHGFSKQYPSWSPLGADCCDFQDLIYLMRTYFKESLPINWIGHSHGGINGYFMAAVEPPGTFSRLVCNAAFLGLHRGLNLKVNPNLRFYFRKRFALPLWYRLDEVIELACQKSFIKLNSYFSDEVMHYVLPTEKQQERLAQLEDGLVISNYEGGHGFPKETQEIAMDFLEQPVKPHKSEVV